eukprot:366256-Chlamydomonas_euryale.AAC.12
MENEHGELSWVVTGVVQPPKHLHAILIVATCMCSHTKLGTCEGHHGLNVISSGCTTCAHRHPKPRCCAGARNLRCVASSAGGGERRACRSRSP